MNGLMNGLWRRSMESDRLTMTFEEFIQSTMQLVDRVCGKQGVGEPVDEPFPGAGRELGVSCLQPHALARNDRPLVFEPF